MPELPEVEAARRAVQDHCIGKKIKKSVIANDPKVIDGVSPSDFEASLLDKTIVAAHRKGKNMWLQLDSPPFPSFQFGMTGAVYIKGVAVTKYKRSAVSDTDEWPSKYSKLFIELDDGLELSFTDKRRLAKVRLLKDPASVPPISELGPDALLEPMAEDDFVMSLSKKKIGIKALLLDQGFISGIGNWIADEVLYQARIHPLQVSASISREGCVALRECIKEVIEKAVGVGADSSQFPSTWIFHSREKKPGKAFVDGKKIEFIAAGGRTTAFVPELQKLTGGQSAKAPRRPTKQSVKESKDEGEDDVDEPAIEDEENAKSSKSKGGRKMARRGNKKPTAKRMFSEGFEDDEDEGDSDDNDDGGQKNKTMVGKDLPAGRKSKRSDDKNGKDGDQKKKTKGPKKSPAEENFEESGDGDQKKKTKGPKKPPAEENSEESGDNHGNGGSDDETDEGKYQEKVKKLVMRKNTKVEKTLEKKMKKKETSQNNQQLKKRAK